MPMEAGDSLTSIIATLTLVVAALAWCSSRKSASASETSAEAAARSAESSGMSATAAVCSAGAAEKSAEVEQALLQMEIQDRAKADRDRRVDIWETRRPGTNHWTIRLKAAEAYQVDVEKHFDSVPQLERFGDRAEQAVLDHPDFRQAQDAQAFASFVPGFGRDVLLQGLMHRAVQQPFQRGQSKVRIVCTQTGQVGRHGDVERVEELHFTEFVLRRHGHTVLVGSHQPPGAGRGLGEDLAVADPRDARPQCAIVLVFRALTILEDVLFRVQTGS